MTLQTFAAFVTPYSMALVAEDIRSVVSSEEDFVNAVLMIVHQISYEVVDDGQYPVETVFENEGDCDLLSCVAASLTISQGFDTVLFYYEHESHMNVGVNLPSAPGDARTPVTYVDHDGTRYYMAECTGGEDWQNGWRVGECPPELKDAQLTVVTLENCEQVAPGQVSSSFGKVESSAMSLTMSSSFVIEGNTILASGQVAVSNPNGTVILYAAANDGWFLLGETELNSDGRYVLLWSPTVWGQYRIKASWSGDDEHAGTESGTVSVYVIPRFLVLVLSGLIVMMIIVIVLLLIHRTTRHQDFQSPAETPQQRQEEP